MSLEKSKGGMGGNTVRSLHIFHFLSDVRPIEPLKGRNVSYE